MKQLYLHIGLGKTGSSALQSWLSLNAELIAQQGIDYADIVPEVKFGESLSGNGIALHHACVDQDLDRVEELLTTTYFFTPGNTVAIVSCELLQGLSLSKIEAIKDICNRNAIEVTIVAYVRSVYEWLYSTYVQFVKRASHTHSFGAKDEDLDFAAFHDNLLRYFEVFGERMNVLNYDAAKKDIYSSFANVTGISTNSLQSLKMRVNRSLSFKEVEILRRTNALHNGAFSTQISNFVISESPDMRSPVYYDAALVERVREGSDVAVQWINNQFALQPPLVSDNFSQASSVAAAAPGKADYDQILEWARAFDPDEAQQRDFVNFLKNFAVMIVKFAGDEVLPLIERACTIQSVVDQRDIAEEEEQPVVARVPLLPRFLMSYFHDVNSTEIHSEGSSFVDRFHAWLDLIAPCAVGSTINPLEDKHVLHGAVREEMGDRPPMSGYSVIEAEDIDTVIALAEKCPLLAIGGVLEVSHVIQLHQGYATKLLESEGGAAG